MSATAEDLGERALIERMCARAPHAPSPAGPGDDAAVLPPVARGRRVLTTDVMMEGVHFLRRHPPRWLGHKLLASNLSDVAAMGGRPEGFVVTAALPGEAPVAWWDALAEGLGALAREAGATLAGGDVVRSRGPVCLGVTAWGVVDGDAPLLRTGGRPGDVLMVAGAVGRAGLGLARWAAREAVEAWGPDPPGEEDPLVRAHLRPEPPLEAGPRALAAGATAGLDLSDGLRVDAPRLALASGVRLVVDLARLPEDPACGEASPAARAAGGEDYGLLVLVPAPRAPGLAEAGFRALGVAEAPGADGPGVTWLLDGAPLAPGDAPFTHFAGG